MQTSVNVKPSVFRAIKSWLWSEGQNLIPVNRGQDAFLRRLAPYVDRWPTRAYALPVFSANAQARWREAGTFSGVIWDSRHLQGQAIRLQRVKTIMQMEVARQHHIKCICGTDRDVTKNCPVHGYRGR